VLVLVLVLVIESSFSHELAYLSWPQYVKRDGALSGTRSTLIGRGVFESDYDYEHAHEREHDVD
jgi:hypothetical protein